MALLIEHIDYLKEESRNKTNHTSHLIGIITTSQINQSFNIQTTINTSMESEIKESNINSNINSTIISRKSSDISMESEILEIDRGLNNTHIMNARQSMEESNTDNDL